jgi:hypothetical protein
MVYDGDDGAVLLYDGQSIWRYNGPGWVNVSTPISPPARQGGAFAYDPIDHLAILFGGTYDVPGDTVFLNDTWGYRGGNWTDLTPATSPPARSYAAMVFDSEDGYLLLFGGTRFNGTWSFVDGVWVNRTGGPAPTGRSRLALVDDPAAQAVILFGGNGCITYFGCGPGCGPRWECSDTWEYIGGHWTNLTGRQASSPSARDEPEAFYDATSGSMILFGGELLSNDSSAPSDEWSFQSGHWTLLASQAPGAGPIPRYVGGVVYDAADNAAFLYGGRSDAGVPLDDAWTYSDGNWTPGPLQLNPPTQDWTWIAFDPPDHEVLVVGGSVSYVGSATEETWTYSSGVWTELFPTLSPPPRSQSGMVFDPGDGYVVLFGGLRPNLGPALNDTWSFRGGTWTNRTTSPGIAPPPRGSFGLAYDSTDGYVLMFGGWDPYNNPYGPGFGDTWKYSGGKWTDLSNSSGTPPSPREGMALADDPVDGYVVGFGGGSFYTDWCCLEVNPFNDTWAFSHGVWQNISPPGSPPNRTNGNMVYDPDCSCVILFGDTGDGHGEQTWSFSRGNWTLLNTTSLPPDIGWTLGEDPLDGYLLLYGGTPGISWKFQWTGLDPGLTALPSQGVLPLSVHLGTNISGGVGPYSLNWSFGDGTSPAYGVSVTHWYNHSGAFTPTVNLTDGAGEYVRASTSLKVASDITASVQATTINGPAPLNVTLNGSASGGRGPYSYRWSFGDGSAGTAGSNVSHFYRENGTFVATLVAEDAENESGSAWVTVRVGESDQRATIHTSGADPSDPWNRSFSATVPGWTSTDQSTWNFGDGTASGFSAPRHTYRVQGVYRVEVEVSNGNGSAANGTLSIEVGSVPAISVSADPISGPAPLAVRLIGTFSGGISPETSWWEFGDGNGSSAEVVNHTYASPGFYTPRFYVRDVNGFVFSDPAPEVQVSDVAAPDTIVMTVDSPSSTVGDVVLFDLTVEGIANLEGYRWAGLPIGCTPGNVSEFSCRPEESGTYFPTVSVTDEYGRVVIASNTLRVAPPLTVAFAQLTVPAAIDGTLAISTQVVGGQPPYRLIWFGLPADCPNSGGYNVTCSVSEPGSYTVNVTVLDSSGHIASAATLFSVPAPPVVQGTPPVHPVPPPPEPTWLFAVAAAGGILLATASFVRSRHVRPKR